MYTLEDGLLSQTRHYQERNISLYQTAGVVCLEAVEATEPAFY